MAIDRQTVNRVAFLARLKIDDDKIEATEEEFNKILNWVEQLQIEAFLAERKILVYTVVHEFFETA